MPKKRDGVMTIRISSEDKEQLLKIAEVADLTLSDVVVRATRDYVRSNPLKGKKAKI
jgi:predicted transcriptional regulator